MKKSILILLVLISGFVYGQNKAPILNPQKPDTSVYYITGRLDDFKLLFNALQNHDDVTPNQIKALLLWINKLELIKKPSKDSVQTNSKIKK